VSYDTYDFNWVRGTTTPFKVSFKIDNVAIPHDDVRMSVYNAGGKTLAFRLSLVDNPGIIPGTVNEEQPGLFSFRPTAAQTRLLTKTAEGDPGKNSYEIEIRNGANEDVYLLGVIAGIGGINDDEA
jgi:hypothetical protein